MKCKFTILLAITLIFVSFGSVAASPQWEELLTLYQNNQLDALGRRLEVPKFAGSEAPEIVFFRTVFIRDGDKAKDQYLQVFEQSNGIIKNLAAKKLMDYFYARGYYVNASRYQKYLADHPVNEPEPISVDAVVSEQTVPAQPKPDTDNYIIQVGAFSIRDNAVQQSQMLATQNVSSLVVEREVNNNTLYCVWVEGTDQFEETLQMANRLKAKYDLEYRIIKK